MGLFVKLTKLTVIEASFWCPSKLDLGVLEVRSYLFLDNCVTELGNPMRWKKDGWERFKGLKPR